MAAFASAEEFATGIEDASERFSARCGMWTGSFVRGEPEPMRAAVVRSDTGRGRS
jgi:hypothetical protein